VNPHPSYQHPQHQHQHGDDDRLLTIDEVAELLRCPTATLRYWRHLGTGPSSFKVGRHVRYYRDDIDTWLRDQEAATGSVHRT
jgi:excisionase family DNA binding protein